MSSNAQRDLYEDIRDLPLAATGTDGGAALRRIAAERLAAHRNRRASTDTPALPETLRVERQISVAAQRVRDAVAARYLQTPSFRDVLAAPSPAEPEPEPESQQSAEPAPQPHSQTHTWIDEPLIPVEPVARMNASIEDSPALEAVPAAETTDDFFTALAPASVDPTPLPRSIDTADGGFQVRPYENLPEPTWLPERSQQPIAPTNPDELQGLDEEIAFRLDPEFDVHLIEPLPIQANIIEFPRQLVAARKARPRLAEGPLRSGDAPEQHELPTQVQRDSDSAFAAELTPAAEFQMRIFEVDPRSAEWSPSPSTEDTADLPAQTTVPAPPASEQPAPEWQNLMLDAREDEHAASWQPTPQTQALAAEPELVNLPVARFELRLMSALVDAACIGMAFVVFATVTALTTSHALEGLSLPAVLASGLALLLALTVLYQGMFFTLGASTPGMYYAHLEFSTLTGRQPSRGLMRRRVTANLLAAAPAGLGLLWSLIDGRSLGWNDRLSGVFLREL